MRFMKFLSIMITATITFLTTNTYATTYYRHIPFTLSMNNQDILIVNYDFTEKPGIRCASNQANTRIEFNYKGHEKSSLLPAILISHLPEKKYEELTDSSGQLIIYLEKLTIPHHSYEVSCNYFEKK
ncbi:MAG: hypothetical protein KIT56_10360 [Gammaproteobacteria bacterium]|nr:hypothetical protein [Gammaproteobacteria bacterium]MCW5584252.1 hypothetical protein [Gammaproteobacteria bacterium]